MAEDLLLPTPNIQVQLQSNLLYNLAHVPQCGGEIHLQPREEWAVPVSAHCGAPVYAARTTPKQPKPPRVPIKDK
jgi:hypothetical protein